MKLRLAIFKMSSLVALNYVLCFFSCVLTVTPPALHRWVTTGGLGAEEALPRSQDGFWVPHSSKSPVPPAVMGSVCGPRHVLSPAPGGLLRVKMPLGASPAHCGQVGCPRGPLVRASSRALTSRPGLNCTTYLEKERENRNTLRSHIFQQY